jgi:hypothetical protein
VRGARAAPRVVFLVVLIVLIVVLLVFAMLVGAIFLADMMVLVFLGGGAMRAGHAHQTGSPRVG